MIKVHYRYNHCIKVSSQNNALIVTVNYNNILTMINDPNAYYQRSKPVHDNHCEPSQNKFEISDMGMC